MDGRAATAYQLKGMGPGSETPMFVEAGEGGDGGGIVEEICGRAFDSSGVDRGEAGGCGRCRARSAEGRGRAEG